MRSDWATFYRPYGALTRFRQLTPDSVRRGGLYPGLSSRRASGTQSPCGRLLFLQLGLCAVPARCADSQADAPHRSRNEPATEEKLLAVGHARLLPLRTHDDGAPCMRPRSHLGASRGNGAHMGNMTLAPLNPAGILETQSEIEADNATGRRRCRARKTGGGALCAV